MAVCNSHSSRYLPTIWDNVVQDEPAEDACQNTDAWKECGEVLSSVTVNCDEADSSHSFHINKPLADSIDVHIDTIYII